MMNEPEIELRNLRVCYGGREVIHDINLRVEKGEFVAIVGKSGCGKSTLLNALAGFIDKEGDVLLPANFGMIFQNYAVFPWLTVKGNILFGIDRERNAGDKIARLQLLLKMTDLTTEARKYPAELSGGQVQRVALARALARNPAVLLMDEPFGALDVYTREKMQAWLLEVWEIEKQAIVFVTHSIDEAIFLSDRVVVLGDGSILGAFRVPFGRPRAKALQFEVPFIELKKQIMDLLEGS
jgi:NitT/TauT family transport system ATP-binding protein